MPLGSLASLVQEFLTKSVGGPRSQTENLIRFVTMREMLNIVSAPSNPRVGKPGENSGYRIGLLDAGVRN